MFADEHVVSSPTTYTPCDAIRITPYAPQGLPDRDQAIT